MPLKCSTALWTRLLADTNMNIHVETRFKTENACRRDRTGGVRRSVKEEETRGGHECYAQRQKYAGQPRTWKDALFLWSPTRTSLIDNLVSMASINFTLLVLFFPPSPASSNESRVFHDLKYRIAFRVTRKSSTQVIVQLGCEIRPFSITFSWILTVRTCFLTV